MKPRLKTINKKLFIGKKIIMNFTNNKTSELWKNFMPERNEIKNKIGNELYSIEIFPSSYFEKFNPDRKFEKWAAVEVESFNSIPDNMETLIIPAGLYLVFIHKGAASTGPKTYNYIFNEYLPHSKYNLDNRPHFAVMGENYKYNDHDAEEEIYIPVIPK